MKSISASYIATGLWSLSSSIKYSDSYTNTNISTHLNTVKSISFSRCIVFDSNSSTILYSQQLSSDSHGISRSKIGSQSYVPSFHLFQNPIRSISYSPSNPSLLLATSSHKQVCVYDMENNIPINL